MQCLGHTYTKKNVKFLIESPDLTEHPIVDLENLNTTGPKETVAPSSLLSSDKALGHWAIWLLQQLENMTRPGCTEDSIPRASEH